MDITTPTKKRPSRPTFDSPNKAAKTTSNHSPARHTPPSSNFRNGSETRAQDTHGVPRIVGASSRASSSLSPHSTLGQAPSTNTAPTRSNEPGPSPMTTRSAGLGLQTNPAPAQRRPATDVAHNMANGSAQTPAQKRTPDATAGLDPPQTPKHLETVDLAEDQIKVLGREVIRMRKFHSDKTQSEIDSKKLTSESREVEAELEDQRAILADIKDELEKAKAMVSSAETQISQSLAQIRVKENLRDTKKAAAETCDQEVARLDLALKEIQTYLLEPRRHPSGKPISNGESSVA